MSAPFLKFPSDMILKTDMWTAVASMSISRDAVGVCLLGDKLYAVEGKDGQTYLIQWRLMIPRQMSGPRYGISCFIITLTVFLLRTILLVKQTRIMSSIKIHSISKR